MRWDRDFAIPAGVMRRTLLVLFCASGFAGLVYQSIWSHYLSLLLGHDAYARSLVLATFMGGMGLGAAIVAHAGRRWRNLVRGYAAVELLLGVAGLGFHFVFVPLYDLTLEQVLPVLGNSVAAAGAKWGIGVALVLPQSVLLGASFPLLSAGLIRLLPAEHGRVLGSLYFTNSMGGAAGALVATFALLPSVGTPGTLQIAGLLNLLVGLIAWLLSREAGAVAEHVQPSRRPGATPAASGLRTYRPPRLLVVMLAATLLSSAASFVYEIAWIRMLGLAVGTSEHAFEIMLAAFIGGMALGGAWVRSRIDRYAQTLVPLACVQTLMGLAALVSLVIYTTSAFEWVGLLVDALPRNNAGYVLYNVGTGVAAIAVMLPAAFFAGATLPLMTAILLRSGQGEGIIGAVYAANTVGAIIGVVAATHLLIPLLGLREAMIVAAGTDIAIGCALLPLAANRRARSIGTPVVAGLGAVAVTVTALTIEFDPYKLASGVFKSGQPRLRTVEDVLFYEDGKTASVSVLQWPSGQRSLTYNGKIDASIQTHPGRPPQVDEVTNVLAGALPLGLVDTPKRGAVIGIGSGLTSHTILADDRVRRLQTIEIERAMVAASRRFGDRVARVHEDPRSQIVIDDARSALARGGEPYDFIVSMPSNPWVAGVGPLFAHQFYDFIDQRLTEDGLFVQWLQLYEIDRALFGSVLTALTREFDHSRAWMANSADMLVVARDGEPIPELDAERLLAGELGKELRRVGLRHAGQFALREVASAGMLPALARWLGEPPNSYYYPRLTLNAPRTRFLRRKVTGLVGLASERSLAMEILGAGSAVGPDDMPGPQAEGAGAVDRNARKRFRLAGLLSGGPDREAVWQDTPMAFQTELLRLWSGNCEALDDRSRRRSWLDLHGRLAGRLVPVLDARALARVWRNPGWMGCAEPPKAVERALAVAADAAARDLESLPSSAAAYLQQPPSLATPGNPLNEMAYLAAQAALVKRGQHKAAQRFRDAHFGAVRLSRKGKVVQAILDNLDANGDLPESEPH